MQLGWGFGCSEQLSGVSPGDGGWGHVCDPLPAAPPNQPLEGYSTKHRPRGGSGGRFRGGDRLREGSDPPGPDPAVREITGARIGVSISGGLFNLVRAAAAAERYL